MSGLSADPDRDDNHAAAEYVLGLLAGDELLEAERRHASDKDFSQLVEQWRVRLAEFDDTAEPIEPGSNLWNRISQTTSTANQETPGGIIEVLHGLWSSIRALRIAAASGLFASVALAVLAGVFFTAARNEATRKPIYVAILVNDGTKQPGAVVNAFSDGRVEMIPLLDINVPQGRALEIWTLWDRAVGPRSVGLIDRARTTSLKLDNMPSTVADQLFEITLEPAGGSPVGRPTGPILFKGTTGRVP